MENVGRYHTPLDTLENFDLRSLQHHGENVAAVLRSVWDLDLKEHPHSERVWFDVAARGVVSWPSAWSTPLALLALLSVLAALRRAHTSGRSRAGPVVASAVIGIGVVALSGFAGRGVASALSAASGVQRLWLAQPLAGVAVIGGIAMLVLVIFARGSVGPARSLLAPGLVWTLLGFVAALRVPGSAHLFLPPALALALLVHVPTRPQGSGMIARCSGVGVLLLALLPWTPTLVGLAAALGTSHAELFCAPLALLGLSIAPLLATISGGLRVVLSVAALAMLLCSAGLTLVLPAHD
jgi:hypothetical protein